MKTYIIKKLVSEPTSFEINSDGWVRKTMYFLEDEFGQEYTIYISYDKHTEETEYFVKLPVCAYSYTAATLRELIELLRINDFNIKNPFCVKIR